MRNAVPFLVIFVGFVAALTIYAVFSGLLPPAAQAETVKMGSTEIAKSSLSFVTSLKRTDGKYYYSMNCTDAAGCRRNAESYTQSGAWTVLAYSGLYDATHDQQYLQKIDSEANDLMKACEGKDAE